MACWNDNSSVQTLRGYQLLGKFDLKDSLKRSPPWFVTRSASLYCFLLLDGYLKTWAVLSISTSISASWSLTSWQFVHYGELDECLNLDWSAWFKRVRKTIIQHQMGQLDLKQKQSDFVHSLGKKGMEKFRLSIGEDNFKIRCSHSRSEFKLTIKNCLFECRDDLLSVPEGSIIKTTRFNCFPLSTAHLVSHSLTSVESALANVNIWKRAFAWRVKALLLCRFAGR